MVRLATGRWGCP